MDPDKSPIPPWMPWAATACLAAAVACVGGVLAVEKAKVRVLADELALSRDAVLAAQNQLVAERIVARREIQDLAAGNGTGGPLVIVLRPPLDPKPGPGARSPVGLAVQLDGSRAVDVLLYGVPAADADHDYQAWVDCGAGCTAASVPFHAGEEVGERLCRIELPGRAPAGARFLLINGKKGGFRSLSEALASGSIVLASAGPSPSISKR